ncbi:TnsA endonuclease N-terminal domain-containing protein [Pseudoxanthomonas mexicana]
MLAGRETEKYYPDVLVERIETVNGEPTQRAELCEIKYREEIFRKWVTLKPKFKACRRYARQRGWRFRILTEVEIRTPRLANAKFLLPYSRRDTDWILEHQVMESVRALGETTIHQYMASLPGSQWDKAAVLPVVYYLICRGEIVANLDQPLTPQSPIRAVDQ